MPRKVIFTSIALRDLARSQDWLNQPGSAKRSKAIAQKIVAAAMKLSETAEVHPEDRYFENCRQLVVGHHVIRFRIVVDDAGEWASVERIYGPGQDRTS